MADTPLINVVCVLRDLQQQVEWGKMILVAHSFGGFIARAFATAYSEDVLGIVFVDSAHYANHFVDKTDPCLVLDEIRDMQSRVAELAK